MFKPQKMTSTKPLQEEAGLLTGLHTFNMQSVAQKLYNRGGHIQKRARCVKKMSFSFVLFFGQYCIQ